MTEQQPTTEVELINLGPDLAKKITEMRVEERFPGVYRLRLHFANGRGASIVTGPRAFIFPADGTYEFCPLDSYGEIAGDRRQPIPVRRGEETEVAGWALEIADLPPESEELRP